MTRTIAGCVHLSASGGDVSYITRKEIGMLASTEVLMEGDPIKSRVTGTIRTWRHRPGERTRRGKRPEIERGATLCTIHYVKDNGFQGIEYVEAPVKCHLIKIIKDNGESVTEGETIGRIMPIHDVPPEIPEELWPFIG